jgi:triacylglycerol lipase
MAVFTYRSLAPSDIVELSRLAEAAYSVPATVGGWTVVTGATLGPASGYVGTTFTNGPAAAAVYRQEDALTVTFRGADNPATDFLDILSLLGDGYIDRFDDLLNAVAAFVADPANGITDVQFTGHSLGGAATNILRDVANGAYGGAFVDADYVAFASPAIADSSTEILNIGYENDWAFRRVPFLNPFGPDTFGNATDFISWYNDDLSVANLNGDNPRSLSEFLANDSTSPHKALNHIDGVARIVGSVFYDDTDRDTRIVLAETSAPIAPLGGTSSAGTGPVLLLGDDTVNTLVGSAFGDWFDAGGGNDFVLGLQGDDRIAGGEGRDEFLAGAGDNWIDGGAGDDIIYYEGTTGIAVNLAQAGPNAVHAGGVDTLIDVEQIVGAAGNDSIAGDDADNLLIGLAGDDLLYGAGGADTLIGGGGVDTMHGGAGEDILDTRGSTGSTLTGGTGADVFVFSEPIGGAHTIADFVDGEDVLLIQSGLASLFEDLMIDQVGSDAVISLVGLSVTVLNTQAGLFDPGDVLLA